MKRIFSVWNPEHLGYDYYEGTAKLREGVIVDTPSLPSAGQLGIVPERASLALPADARMVGRGPQARGQIASRNGHAAMGGIIDDARSFVKIGLLIAGGWFVWKKVLTPTQRRKVTLAAHGRKRKR